MATTKRHAPRLSSAIRHRAACRPQGYLFHSEQLRDPSNNAVSGIYLRGTSKTQLNIWCWPIGSGEVVGYREGRALFLFRDHQFAR